MKSLLEVKDLCIDFVKHNLIFHAIENISFTINKAEVVAIVGESGSGKSVTALSILGLLPTNISKIKSGEIHFNENICTDLLKCNNDMLKSIRGNKIAMIYQEPMTSLNPVITCGEQVSEVLRTHQNISSLQAKEKTIDLFREVELPNPNQVFYRFPHQLSGGQKQRVMIAMALSCSPQILICDEPTTALDVLTQKNILLILKKLQKEKNISLLFISHDLGVVKNIADKIMVLYKGKIVETNDAETIFLNPQHAYTKALLLCKPIVHNKNERLPVVSDFIDNKKEDKKEQIKIITEKNNVPVIKDPSNILKVENIQVWFPSKNNFFGKPISYNKAVDDVSFNIEKSETVGLVGGSGCGKTTLGRTILRLIEPTSGKIFFKQKDISRFNKNETLAFRKDVQIIFQDPYSSLNPRQKIGEAIAEPMYVHQMYDDEKKRQKEVLDLLEKVNLPPFAYHRYPHEFSGGQRQRIVIARALALKPSFLICDECISALDVSVQAQVLNLLNDLKKDFNLTILFISHDLSAVHYLCDKIIVMNEGKIEEMDDAEKIWKSPQSVYTKKLLQAVEYE